MIVHCAYDQLIGIDELKLHPKNRNEHPPEQIERLAKVLKYQGWRYAVNVSNQTGLVNSGHGRILAAKLNGWTHVPVKYQDFENEDQEYASLIADNAIASWAELDLAGVNFDIPALGPDFEIDMLGIENFVIEPFDKLDEEAQEKEAEDHFLDDDESEEENSVPEKEDEVPEKIEPRVKSGESYRIGTHQLFNGDCLKVLKKIPDHSVDSLVTDPPAGIAFMGKEWDEDKGGSKEWIKWMTQVMTECLRVMKPGAHGLVWAIPRTSHWTATALEDAGFEIRDVVTHLFGSGFPKSLDISKAIDKAAGAEREVIGEIVRTGSKGNGNTIHQEGGDKSGISLLTAPSTPEAKQWQGWGTALKPASEHWILIRKPCAEKTVAANILKHGTGGINIDASRIAATSEKDLKDIRSERPSKTSNSNKSSLNHGSLEGLDRSDRSHVTGRFPANLILSHNPDCVEVGTRNIKSGNPNRFSKTDGGWGVAKFHAPPVSNLGNGDGTETVAAWECTENCAVAMLDEQSGDRPSGKGNKNASNKTQGVTLFKGIGKGIGNGIGGDSGGASRFFYVAKASKKDKGSDNSHPTVKSTGLMRYFIKMVTPSDGIVLDCFGGSGTTMIAANMDRFSSILIEQSTEYCDIILARAEHMMEKSAIKGDL